MDVRIAADALFESNADTLFIFSALDNEKISDVIDNIDSKLNGLLVELFESKDFTGKTGETTIVYPRSALNFQRIILIGIGSKDEITVETVRRASANALKHAKKVNARHIAAAAFDTSPIPVGEVARGLAEGVLLADYDYVGQKTSDTQPNSVETLTIYVQNDDLSSARTGLKLGQAMAEGANIARDLANLPPNICTPTYLASKARGIADQNGLKIEILERKQIEALKMGAFLAVAQGSETPPRFIILEHNATQSATLPTIVLVGKGVTFDTGGYTIKTGEGMVGMKLDMSGAAAVLGAMHTISTLKLPVHAVGLVPAADNMISGKSYRPQDVVTASNGKTIEVISTDAEGRMLLADALVYAKRYNPDAVIDIATLTGSCVVALGSAAAGFFVTDDTLRQKLNTAAEATHERIWQLPLFPEYKKAIESNTADMKNTGGRTGGVGTSAVFLQQFVDFPAWAHIDMAAMAQGIPEISYIPAVGATGYGARLLAECVRQYVEEG